MKRISSKACMRILAAVCGIFLFSVLLVQQEGAAKSEQVFNSEEIIEMFISFDEKSILAEMQYEKLPFLVGEYDIVDVDISEERILLQLADEQQGSFLRIAQWDDDKMEFIVIDSAFLPAESCLDTYHDGNAVLLLVSMEEESMDVNSMAGNQLFITFEWVDDGWYLTSFTDGQTFVSELQEQSYLFNDYYEPSEEYAWEVEGALRFEAFCTEILWDYIHEYDEANEERPSVQ